MTFSLSRRPGALCRAVVLAGVAALVPLPLAAADHAPGPSSHSLQKAIAKQAANVTLKTTGARTASSRQTGSSTDPRKGGFFRSPAGIACVAVLAVGVGYAVYSSSHDRIHSVARQGQ